VRPNQPNQKLDLKKKDWSRVQHNDCSNKETDEERDSPTAATTQSSNDAEVVTKSEISYMSSNHETEKVITTDHRRDQSSTVGEMDKVCNTN
jgi:hypothetical protein